MNDIPIIGAIKTERTVEVCRSFSYKMNLSNHGGPAYESVDLFASRKMQVTESDAPRVSEELYQECMAEVRGAIERIKANMRSKIEAQRERKSA